MMKNNLICELLKYSPLYDIADIMNISFSIIVNTECFLWYCSAYSDEEIEESKNLVRWIRHLSLNEYQLVACFERCIENLTGF